MATTTRTWAFYAASAASQVRTIVEAGCRLREALRAPRLAQRVALGTREAASKLARAVRAARGFWRGLDSFPQGFADSLSGRAILDETRRDRGAHLRLDERHRPDLHPDLASEIFSGKRRPVLGPSVRQRTVTKNRSSTCLADTSATLSLHS